MDCLHSGKELRGSGFGGILQACRAEHHWRSRGALGTFGASTFDAAFDAYVLARVTRSCLAVRARVSLTYDWQALQQELELARTPRWHPSFCDFDTLTAFDDAPCNALRAGKLLKLRMLQKCLSLGMSPSFSGVSFRSQFSSPSSSAFHDTQATTGQRLPDTATDAAAEPCTWKSFREWK